MTIQTGDTFPSMPITIAAPDGAKETTTNALFGGVKAVLFAVPGAFTPTCSERHLPGFLDKLDDLEESGAELVVCLAVNDPFVLRAWAKHTGADGKITFIADGSGTLTKALGLELDLTARGLGVRAQRFAMILSDMQVVYMAVEQAGQFSASSAEEMLEHL